MTEGPLESLCHPAWWDQFVGARLSSAQLSDLAADVARLRPIMPELMRAFRASSSRAAAQAANVPWDRVPTDELLAGLRGAFALDRVLDALLGPLTVAAWDGTAKERWATQQHVFVGYILLRALADTPTVEAASQRAVQEWRAAALFLVLGPLVDAELTRRGAAQRGPSFAAWRLRTGLAFGQLDDRDAEHLLDRLARAARTKMTDPALADELRGDAESGMRHLYGPAYEIIKYHIPLPEGLDAVLATLGQAITGKWNYLSSALAWAARDEAVKGHPSPLFQCRACGHVWEGRGKGKHCPKCGASGIDASGDDRIRTTVTRRHPLDLEEGQ